MAVWHAWICVLVNVSVCTYIYYRYGDRIRYYSVKDDTTLNRIDESYRAEWG